MTANRRVNLLDGVRVVDFGHYLAGPGVGRYLADLGADVQKVDRPQDQWLGTVFDHAANYGKKRHLIDLKSADGLTAARDLIRDADIVIENFRPGAMTELGLSYERVAEVNPRVIWLSMPAFPAGDLEHQHLAGWEDIIAAASGLILERGPNHKLRRSPPVPVSMPMASAYAVAFGSLAVLAALLGRERSGAGDYLEVSLFGSLLEGLANNHLDIQELPTRYIDRRERALRDPGRVAPGLTEGSVQNLMDPLYRAYRCADDRWFYIAIPPHRRLVTRTLQVLGIWNALIEAGLPTDDPYLTSCCWRSRAEGTVFGMPSLADHWLERLQVDIACAIQERSSLEWERTFDASGLAGYRVSTSEEWLRDPHVRKAELIRETTDAQLGAVLHPGPFSWLVRRGERSAAIARPLAAGLPYLSGLRILDLTNVLAGPTIAGNFVRFGAEVIKIDAPEAQFDPTITMLLPLAAGRGKRSMLLDLKSEEGQVVFKKLVAGADLIVYNGPSSQLSELGLDFATLETTHPGITLCQLSAFGGPSSGPLEERKGFDEILQAATGIIARTCGQVIAPEEFAQFGTVDVISGVLGSAAAVAAMYAAHRDGFGAWVGVSLAAGASLIQWPHLCRQAAAVEHDTWSSTQYHTQILEAMDGTMVVRCTAKALQTAGLRNPLASIEHLNERCRELGWAAQRLNSYADLRAMYTLAPEDSPRCRKPYFLVDSPHPAASVGTVIGPCAIYSEATQLRLRPDPPPKPGAATRELLKELGLGAAEIDHLIQIGVTAESWPQHREYLPS